MAALVEPLSQVRDGGVMVPFTVEEALGMLPGVPLHTCNTEQQAPILLTANGSMREQQQQGSCGLSATVSDDEATMDESQSSEGDEDVDFKPRPRKKQRAQQQKGHTGKDAVKSCRNHTGYIGVRRRQWGMFAAEIRDGDKRRWLGSFNQASEAGMAYDAALILQKKHRAKTNFIYTDFSTMPRPGAEHGGCVRYTLIPKEVLELYKTQYNEVMSIMDSNAKRHDQRGPRAKPGEERIASPNVLYASPGAVAVAALSARLDPPAAAQPPAAGASRLTKMSSHTGTVQQTAAAGALQQPAQVRGPAAPAHDTKAAAHMPGAPSVQIKSEVGDAPRIQHTASMHLPAACTASPARQAPAAAGDRGGMASLKPVRVPHTSMANNDTTRGIVPQGGPAPHLATRHSTGLAPVNASGLAALPVNDRIDRLGGNAATAGGMHGSPASASRAAAARAGSRMRQVGYFEHEAAGPVDSGNTMAGMDSNRQVAMYIPAGQMGYMAPMPYSMAPMQGTDLQERPASVGHNMGHMEEEGEGAEEEGGGPGYPMLGAPYGVPPPSYSMVNMGPHGMVAMPFGPGMHPMGYPYAFPMYPGEGHDQSGDDSGETETDGGSGDEDGEGERGMPGAMPAMYMYSAPTYGMHPWGPMPPHMQGPHARMHPPGMPAVMGHLPKPAGMVVGMGPGMGREGTGASPRSHRNPAGTGAGRPVAHVQECEPAVWGMCAPAPHAGAAHGAPQMQTNTNGWAARPQYQNASGGQHGSEESEQHSHVPLAATASSQLNPTGQVGTVCLQDSPSLKRKATVGSNSVQVQPQLLLRTLDLSGAALAAQANAIQDAYECEDDPEPTQAVAVAAPQPFPNGIPSGMTRPAPPIHPYGMPPQAYPMELEHPIKQEAPAYEQMPLSGYPTVYSAPSSFMLPHVQHQVSGWPHEVHASGQVSSPRRGLHGAKAGTALPHHHRMMQAQ